MQLKIKVKLFLVNLAARRAYVSPVGEWSEARIKSIQVNLEQHLRLCCKKLLPLFSWLVINNLPLFSFYTVI
jgi:hypothetical protein